MNAERRLQVLDKQLKSQRHSVVIVGAVVVDINATPETGQKPQPGGSVPGVITSQFGGVGHNIAATLATILKQKTLTSLSTLLVQNCNDLSQLVFMTVVGDDEHGKNFLNQWKKKGLSCDAIKKLKSKTTPSVSTIFGDKGEVVASIADVNLTVDKQFLASKQQILKNADLMVIDGNLSGEIIEYLCCFAENHRIKIWYEPVSVPKSVRGTFALGKMFCASPNVLELKQMAIQIKNQNNLQEICIPNFCTNFPGFEDFPDWCKNILEDVILCLETGLQYLVITAGSNGAALCTTKNVNYNNFLIKQKVASNKNQDIPSQFLQICIVPAIQTQIVNTSGAGDTLVAGCMFGILNNQCMQESLFYGVAMATQAVKISGTVPLQLNAQKIAIDCNYLRNNSKVYSLQLQ